MMWKKNRSARQDRVATGRGSSHEYNLCSSPTEYHWTVKDRKGVNEI